MAREINLVPDVKGEMIKTLKLRNFIFFICIIVAAVCVGIIAIFGSIVGGQQLAIDSKRSALDSMSSKLNSYSDLNDFLTIRDQLGNLATLTDNKQVLSRTFNILYTLLPSGADTITVSELNVNLADENPTFSFDAQANAGRDPFIDYNVLDAFKKSMKYMRYDYGEYVDREGATIPAYCVIETGEDGATLSDGDKNYYGLWTIGAEGCNPSNASYQEEDEEESEEASTDQSETESSSDNSTNLSTLDRLFGNRLNNNGSATNSDDNTDDTDTDAEATTNENNPDAADAYPTEDYNGTRVVRIWRTPQYEDWYKAGYLTLDGQISGVPHFESSCITYQGESVNNRQNEIKWTEASNTCMLVPDGDDGIKISDSSNGRGAGDELVLRFSAIITLDSAAYNFNNHHMMAIPPEGRRNVTDSYVQIQAMFGEKARDCEAGDTQCATDTRNLNGGNN